MDRLIASQLFHGGLHLILALHLMVLGTPAARTWAVLLVLAGAGVATMLVWRPRLGVRGLGAASLENIAAVTLAAAAAGGEPAWSFPVYLLAIVGAAASRDNRVVLMTGAAAGAAHAAMTAWAGGGLAADPQLFPRLALLGLLAWLTGRITGEGTEFSEAQRERLTELERMASAGRTAAEIAHGVKSCLSTILVNAEILLLKRQNDRELERELERMRSEIKRSNTILRGLMDLGGPGEMAMEPLDPVEPLHAALSTAQPVFAKAGITVENLPERQGWTIRGNYLGLFQAYLAVINNAAEAMPRGGAVRLSARRARRNAWWRHAARLACLEIVIADTGPGIPEENLPSLFRPFFTTKAPHGNGLGLASAMTIMRQHGGLIEAHSRPGKGAAFTFILPEGDGVLERAAGGRSPREEGKART